MKRKLFVKKIKFIIGILLWWCLLFRVDAGINDSSIKKNKVDNIYAVANVRGKDHLYYLNMYTLNDKTAYCIELGVDITSEIYNSTYDFAVSNLTNNQIEYIKNVSYFGYGYNNRNDHRYYMATQEIIWEYLSGTEVEWTNVLDVNGPRINIDNYKQDILDLLNDYYKGNNFSNYKKDMNVVIGDKIELVDSNNNIKYYEIEECKHCSAMINGNLLNIEFVDNYVGKATITLKRKDVYNYDSLLYYQNDSQKLISNGNIEDKIVLSFNIKGKDIKIQLKDTIEFQHNSQFDYSGIEFDLYDKNKNNIRIEILVDKDGKLYIDNMPYGTYYVKQRRYNYAYLFNNVFQKIVFDDDEIIYVDIIPLINKYKFLKLYGEDEFLVGEQGVVFDIYNIDNTLYKSVVTDINGEVEFELPYGDYIVKQQNSMVGYAMVEEFYINNKVVKSGVNSYTLVDEIIKGNVFINSKDIFGNYIKDYDFEYKIKSNDKYLEVDGIDIFRSIDGVLKLPMKLEYGDYYIEIINKSNFYINKSKGIEFKIDDNNLELRDGEFYLEIDVVYDFYKRNIEVNSLKEVLKVEDGSYYYGNEIDSNVKFSLIASNDIVINNNIIYQKDEKILDFITDKDGKYNLKDLYLGSYCLIDESGINNCFEVVDKEKKIVEIVKKLDKGSIKINVISKTLEVLSEKVLELYDSNNRLMYIGMSNDNGVVKIDNLVYGDYCIKVKDSFNKENKCFKIDNNNMLEIDVVLSKRSNKLFINPNTYNDRRDIVKLIFLLIISLVMMIKVMRKFIN